MGFCGCFKTVVRWERGAAVCCAERFDSVLRGSRSSDSGCVVFRSPVSARSRRVPVPFSDLTIVQLVTRRQRRGAEVIATDLADALQGRGHRSIVLGLGPPPGAVLTPREAEAADLTASGEGPLHLARVLELGRVLDRLAPDVVQANGGYAMKYAVTARLVSRARWPLVYCNIGLSSDWLRSPVQRAWNRWLMRRVEATAAVSEASRQDLLATYGLDPARVRVVRRGLATEALGREAGRRRLAEAGVPPEGTVLLHVGSFSPEKNHAGLLRIVEQVRAGGESVHLVLVGDGALRAEVLCVAGAHVHALGLRDDVPTLLAGADLFVLPSLTEGIPGVILEAAVQRVPSVAYDVGGVGEVVRDGETGRLVASGDEAGAADAVLSLLRDPAERERLGEAARALVVGQFSLDGSVDGFEALYREVLS